MKRNLLEERQQNSIYVRRCKCYEVKQEWEGAGLGAIGATVILNEMVRVGFLEKGDI